MRALVLKDIYWEASTSQLPETVKPIQKSRASIIPNRGSSFVRCNKGFL